jgi:uncharacterized integral membrane protein
MRWILMLPLVVLLVLFGLSNRQPVALRLWPFDLSLMVPVSVAVLVFAALAFLFGALVAWLGALPWRRRAKRMQEAARVLEAELAEYRAREAREVGPVPPPASNAPRLTRSAA